MTSTGTNTSTTTASTTSGAGGVADSKSASNTNSRRVSRAEVLRRAEASTRAQQQQQVPALPAGLTEILATYTPAACNDFEALRSTVWLIMARSAIVSPASFRKTLGTLVAYLDWRNRNAHTLEIGVAMNFVEIDRYIHAIDGFEIKTRQDYRSRLRRLAMNANPSLGATPLPKISRQPVQTGYTNPELAAIVRVVTQQRNVGLRRSLCAAVALGAGAGADSKDLRNFRRVHIEFCDNGIHVHFQQPRPRTVVLRRDFEAMLIDGIKGLKPNDLVIGKVADRRNIVASIVNRAEINNDCVHIEARRLRATWLSWLMSRRVPLKVILEAAGLVSIRTLSDLAAQMPATSAGVAAPMLRGTPQ